MAGSQTTIPAEASRHVRSTTLVAALRASTYVSGALTAVLVARFLGPHDRGVWAVALLIASMVALASELGVGMAVLRFARQDPRRKGSVGASGLVLVLATSCFAAAGAGLATHLRVVPGLVGIPWAIGALALTSVIPVNISGVCRQALLEDGDLPGVAGSQAVQALLVLVLISVGFGLFGLSVLVAVLGFLIAQVLVTLWILFRTARRGLISGGVCVARLRALLSYGVQAHVGILALFLTYRSDLLLVNHLLGPASAGVYSIALTLSEVLRVLPEAGQMRVFAGRTAAAERSPAVPVARAVLLLTAVVGVVTAVLSHWLVPLVFGPPFAQASALFVALIPGMAALAVSYSLSPVLVLRGRIRANSAVASVTLVVMIGLDLLVIPRWGLVGAACVSSLAYGMLALLQVRLVQREEPFQMRDLVPGRAEVVGLGSHLGALSGLSRSARNGRFPDETLR